MYSLGPYYRKTRGEVEYLFGWLIGIPIPILILIYFIRGH